MPSSNEESVRRLEGQIVKIDLKDGTVAYGRVLKRPLFAFYDKPYRCGDTPELEEIATLPIAFKICVMNYSISKRIWSVIGRLELTSDLKKTPSFFKQDILNGALSIYRDDLPPAFERPATLQECMGLEQAAVWDPCHVEDRLRDHFAGRPSKWVQHPMAPEAFEARRKQMPQIQ